MRLAPGGTTPSLRGTDLGESQFAALGSVTRSLKNVGRNSRMRPLWTRQAVQELIQQQTEQLLPIRTVGQYLSRWGYTPQKPVRKAYKQDPAEVQHWLDETYPQIEKRAVAEDAE